MFKGKLKEGWGWLLAQESFVHEGQVTMFL